MIEGIKAVAFDIDGTLYPDWKLYVRIAGHFLRHIWFFHEYNEVRKELRRSAPVADLFEYQGRLMAHRLHISIELAKRKVDEICYKALEPYFEHIAPYYQVYETIVSFKEAGLKIALFSDFPPEQKGDIWGLLPLCDVLLGSESAGALKPSPYSFGILAQKLELEPHEILYIGNSKKYDVGGANNAGMKSGYIMRGFRRIFNIPYKKADVSFRNYQELREIVLGSSKNHLE